MTDIHIFVSNCQADIHIFVKVCQIDIHKNVKLSMPKNYCLLTNYFLSKNFLSIKFIVLY